MNEALDYLNQMNADERIEYADYSNLHDLVVDRGQVTPEHGWADWFRQQYTAHRPMSTDIGASCECGNASEPYSQHLSGVLAAAILALVNEKGNE